MFYRVQSATLKAKKLGTGSKLGGGGERVLIIILYIRDLVGRKAKRGKFAFITNRWHQEVSENPLDLRRHG